jgi:Uma2 family endonuclease
MNRMRVRTGRWEWKMSHTTDEVTRAEQLAALPDDGNRYELVEGVLKMISPAGFRHGRIAGKLLRRIGDYVEKHRLGETSTAETGFLIRQDPDSVRAPDVAFIASDRVAPFVHHAGYLPLAPDLVAEVVSPGDSSSDVESKALGWLDAGVRRVLVVDPQTSTIRVYRPGSQIRVHTDGYIDLAEVLPGFRLDVAELFA